MVAKASRQSADNSKFKLPRLRRSNNEKSVGYFRGAWQELRQVRWPDRSATWGMTIAVICFSLIFAAIILGLDFVFNELFRKVLF